MNELAQPFADLAEQLEFVTAERDRLRDAVELLRVDLERLREEVKNAVYYRECRDKWREQAESRQAEFERLREENKWLLSELKRMQELKMPEPVAEELWDENARLHRIEEAARAMLAAWDRAAAANEYETTPPEHEAMAVLRAALEEK